jgi:hypothetical protein
MILAAASLALPRMSPRSAPLFRVYAKLLTIKRLASCFICIITAKFPNYLMEKLHI